MEIYFLILILVWILFIIGIIIYFIIKLLKNKVKEKKINKLSMIKLNTKNLDKQIKNIENEEGITSSRLFLNMGVKKKDDKITTIIKNKTFESNKIDNTLNETQIEKLQIELNETMNITWENNTRSTNFKEIEESIKSSKDNTLNHNIIQFIPKNN